MSPESHRHASCKKSSRTGKEQCFVGRGKRIVCPVCGNDQHFYEVAADVVLTTKYVQNRDGSFTALFDDSSMNGTVHFYCAECDEDLTRFHARFVEMLF